MNTILSNFRRTSGLAAVITAGLTLAACAGPMADSPVRYAQNSSPRVMSDAVPAHHAVTGFGNDEACVSNSLTFVDDCGGFAHYAGP